jgi:hypothetical protein
LFSLAIDTPDLLQFLTPTLLARVFARTQCTNEQLIDLIEGYFALQRDTISAVDLQPLSSMIDWDDDNAYRLFLQSDLWRIDSALARWNLSQILECR